MQHVLEPTLGTLVFWLATVAWIGEPFVFRSASGASSGAGRAERLGMASAILAAFLLSAVLHAKGVGNLESTAAATTRAVGLALYAGGAMLRYASATSLGSWFTRDVRVELDQDLVAHGPYRWLRHPLYVGLYALACGLVLQFANVWGAAVAALLVSVPIAMRVRREERLMAASLGQRYRDWSAGRLKPVAGLF